MSLTVCACLARAPRPLPELAELSSTAPSVLTVRLHFGDEADLDLHVTDPGQETVYFGNNPSRSGGMLSADLRCDDAAPRIEAVTLESPRPGRYRVGIDFVTPCRRVREPVPFQIHVVHGETDRLLEGEIAPNRFDHDFVEFEIGH